MICTPHSYLIGRSAEALADELKLEKVKEAYYSTQKRWKQLEEAKLSNIVARDHDITEDSDVTTVNSDGGGNGTVGCVVMYMGSIAAATSTGGMTNKLPGRIGGADLKNY